MCASQEHYRDVNCRQNSQCLIWYSDIGCGCCKQQLNLLSYDVCPHNIHFSINFLKTLHVYMSTHFKNFLFLIIIRNPIIWILLFPLVFALNLFWLLFMIQFVYKGIIPFLAFPLLPCLLSPLPCHPLLPPFLPPILLHQYNPSAVCTNSKFLCQNKLTFSIPFFHRGCFKLPSYADIFNLNFVLLC